MKEQAVVTQSRFVYTKELVERLTVAALRGEGKRDYKGCVLHQGNVLEVDYQNGIGLISFTVR